MTTLETKRRRNKFKENFPKDNAILGLYFVEGLLMSRKCIPVLGPHFLLLHFAEGTQIFRKYSSIFCKESTNFTRNITEYMACVYYYVLGIVYQFCEM
jgi:hypothetical protein